MTMTTLRCSVLLLGLPLLLVAAGCGGSDKKEGTTPDKEVNAAKAGGSGGTGAAPAPSGGTTVAQNTPPPPPPPAGGPTPSAPTPEETAPATSSGPPPTDLVRNALLFVRRGKHEEAIRSAKAALKRDEKYVPAMVVMARAYYHLGKLEFAGSVCDIALGINPSTGECYNIKGFVALKTEDEVEARQMFEKATQVQPSLGAPWLNLGGEYLKVKNYPAAIPTLKKATELMPSRPEAYLNLGSAYRGDGQVVQAYNAYTQALKLRSNNYPEAYFNLGILFLDAQTYPGMDKLQQLNTAVTYFNKYKSQMSYLPKDDPVDGYIKEAQKAYEREQKQREREAKRKAREAARAQPKPAPAPEKAAPTPAKEGDGK